MSGGLSRAALGAASAVMVVGVTVALAGCGESSSSASGTGAAGPPAASSSHTAANPCSLLTGLQLRKLNLNQGEQQPNTADLGGVSCSWTNFPLYQDNVYSARLLSAPVPGGTATASVGGLPSTQLVPAGADARTHCAYQVQVASNEVLWAEYGNTSGNQPGMTHQVACQKAQAAAVSMISTYRSLKQ